MSRPARPIAERLWERVDKSEGPNACWPWTGPTAQGYGRIGRGGRSGGMEGSHRVAYELVNGPIPAGHAVCHTCDNPPCCNPAHLFTAPHLDNMADMRAKRRSNLGARNRSAKLTADQVASIRREHAAGKTGKDLAAAYGVGKGQISLIVRGLSWREST